MSAPSLSGVARLLILAAWVSLAGVPVLAAPAEGRQAAAGVKGTVTALGQTVPLPGVVVELRNAQGELVATAITDQAGRFTLDAPRSGDYRLKIAAEGFAPVDRPLALSSGTLLAIDVELRLAATYQQVEVRAKTNVSIDLTSPANPGNTIDGRWLSASAMSAGSVDAGLRWMSGVMPYGREWAIKGGRPNQLALEVDASRVVDPAAGSSPVQIPADAIESFQVLANPYAVEFGGFSSGVIAFSSRAPSRSWYGVVNNFLPGFRLKRNSHPFDITGIESADPRVTVGGPLVDDRLLVVESAQYRYNSSDVGSRPEDQRRVSNSFSNFTRLDLIASSRQMVSGVFAAAPENLSQATLSTFDPPEATADVKQRSYRVAINGTTQLPGGVLLESLVNVIRYRTSVDGHGAATEMTLAPEGNSGIYYASQQRRSTAVQVRAAATGVIGDALGQHVLKAGLDVMRVDYRGVLAYRPIDVLREDGTRTLRLDILPSQVGFRGTGSAAFLEDRWSLGGRTTVTSGVRVERDGVFGGVNLAPRVGGAFVVSRPRHATIRGGWGYFFERTPTSAATFDQQEGRTEQPYAVDGLTFSGPPIRYSDALGSPLDTARSITWNVGYEDQPASWLSVRLNYLHRAGSHELIVDALRDGADGRIALSSTGTSLYRDIEVGAHLNHGTRFDADLSYTHSRSLADLNPAYDYFLTMTANPIVRDNAYGTAGTDVPNRFVARGHAQLGENWMFEAATEIMSGTPYSAVNEQLEFVGPRNTRRFPVKKVLDVSVERRVRIGKLDPWIGLVFLNAFNTYNPVEVQANVASPAFGTFYNSRIREIRILARFRR